MDLIIVESPTKAKTLTKFLKGKYHIEASMGHIRDLPRSILGVDVEQDFAPKYIIPKDKTKRVKELISIAEKADSVVLATDPDREGEAIAWHIAEILNSKVKVKSKKVKGKNVTSSPVTSHLSPVNSFARIVFHEITESAITEALAHPRTLDIPLVDAQQARRVLDRLVGYKLSPLLWQKLSKRWLSAGRVQSVAVRLIVEREREIIAFTKEPYFTIEGVFVSQQNELIRAILVSGAGAPYEQVVKLSLFDGKYQTTTSTIKTEDEAKTLIDGFCAPFTVSAVDTKEVKRYPAPPYITSTLQQDAGRKLYFSAKKTMQIAQKLYEEGYISYHRTDSVNLSEKFITEARTYIKEMYGDVYIPTEPRLYQTKSKVAQEAHEAIRPTNVDMPDLKSVLASTDMNRDHERLYELIWKRAVGCQAKEAVFDTTVIAIESANTFRFEANGTVIKFDGFLRVTGKETDETILPRVTVGETVALENALPVPHTTMPPPRYTEATLVKALEEKGIGRPSTYAPIISTIQDRQYVAKFEKKLVPTDLGNTVTDFLVTYFPDILSLPFTANLEDDLDAIANGVKQWVPVLRSFYDAFAKDITRCDETAEKVKTPVEMLEEKCPECSNLLVIRTGRYGKFIACSNFPTCKYTRQIVEKIDVKCPRCGGDMVVKKSRRGKSFYGCGNYPTCTFAAWKKEDIK